MAFSTFRGMMAANNGATPPAFSDTFTNEPPFVMYVGATIASWDGMPIQGKSATSDYYYIAGNSSTGNIEAWVVRSGDTAFTTYNSLFSVATAASGTGIAMGCSIDSTNCFITYDTGARANMTAVKLTQSGGTFTKTQGPTNIATGGTNLTSGESVKIDANSVMVWIDANTAAQRKFVYWNTNGWSSIQSTGASSITTLNSQNTLCYVSSSLACLVWLNASRVLQVSSLDIVAGTSFTLNAAQSTGITPGNGSTAGGAGAIGVTSTKILIAYCKAVDTIGACTIDIAVGGAITVNTEYTASAPGISVFFRTSLTSYGSNFVATYTNDTPQNLGAIGISVSGNVVTFSTAGAQTINNSGGITTSHNGVAQRAIPIDSSHFAVGFQVGGPGGTTIQTCKVDVNNATPTWGTFTGINAGESPLVQSLNLSAHFSAMFIGTNRLVLAGESSGGTLQYAVASMFGDQSALQDNTLPGNVVDTTITNGISLQSLQGTISGTTAARVLVAYTSASNTVTTGVLSISKAGAPSLGTTTTFTATGISAVGSSNVAGLVALDTDHALYFNKVLSTGSIFANVITLNTNANTISATGTNTSVYSKAGFALVAGTFGFSYQGLSSTKVMLMFQSQISGANRAMDAIILSVSGTTVTAGSAVNIYNSRTNFSTLMGFAAFTNGTGIIVYANDANPGTSIIAVPFTYSGTTITLGTPNTVLTSLSITVDSGNGQQVIPLSSTEAMVVYNNGSNYKLVKLTYVSQSTVTAGTPVTGGTYGDVSVLLATDTVNPNTFFHLYSDVSDTTINTNQYYRG